ncbi:putative FAD/NAD(P)-binding domain-containing protein [Seiridium cardinale]|uniref:FAD/NAD(P)-binding domain-containing protein n=1 Tax=Seiridium cardinale TaxID=138064 RepID=A0ABR2Y516_9PEZI
MASDKLTLTYKSILLFGPLLFQILLRRITAIRHRWTYKAVKEAKNVVVIGGSFAGFELSTRLMESLPTGFKVILIEKNSHFNYLFNFPRFSVLPGHEHTAFIPYDKVGKNAPEGIFTRIQGEAVGVTDNQVLLASGEKIDYCYLAVATGSAQPLPAKVSATERNEACLELQSVQENIKDKNARSIAVVGAGAVGVELASDIKDIYPDKSVTLIHSRSQLLSQFGKKLHDYVMHTLEESGIRVLLNERPRLSVNSGSLAKNQTLTFSDGHEESFDLVISSTGQRPNSHILASIYPDAISKATSRINVKPTLQIDIAHDPSPRIFALGDIAEHGGPRMARAVWFQAGVVANNIVAMAQGRQPSTHYAPAAFLEGAIKLTLGQKHYVTYGKDEKGQELLVPSHNGKVDLDIAKGWWLLGHAQKDVKTAEPVKSA